MTDTEILDHLSAGHVYIEIDEPNGFVTWEGKSAAFRVARARPANARTFRTVGYFSKLRDALAAALDTAPDYEEE